MLAVMLVLLAIVLVIYGYTGGMMTLVWLGVIVGLGAILVAALLPNR